MSVRPGDVVLLRGGGGRPFSIVETDSSGRTVLAWQFLGEDGRVWRGRLPADGLVPWVPVR